MYYVVSPVHVRNAQLLAPLLVGWDLCIAYEQQNSWFTSESMASLPFKVVAIPPEGIPESLWGGRVRCIVMSTVQPWPIPIALVSSALERGVPTIALEESNQIALNLGMVNNYILPVDHVFTASEYERQGMVEAGFPARRFEVTGWPFYTGQVGAVAPEERKARKEAIGLDPSRPVASLTLQAHPAAESAVVRRKQLTLAAQGLPPEYQLVIKPHPIETREDLQPFVDECAPRAMILEGALRVEELLGATNVLLNRGVSQVCIEALLQEVPVIVLETGIRTPFHDVAQALIVEREQDVAKALGWLARTVTPMDLYDAFRARHMPFLPQEARARTCQRIIEIANRGERDPDLGKQWFDLALYQAWRSNRDQALKVVAYEKVRTANCPAQELKSLVEYRAGRDELEELSHFFGKGFQGHVLRCLWIDQLERRREQPEEVDLNWMSEFPPNLMPVWFVPYARKWAFIMLSCGQVGTAREFVQRMRDLFIHVPGVLQFVSDVEIYLSGPLGRIRVTFSYKTKKYLETVAQRVKRLLKLRL